MKLIPNKPRTSLTDAERRHVNQLTREAILTRGRLHGPRLKLRKAGIVSAVVRGVVGSSVWGRSMLARRGGQALARLKLRRKGRDLKPLQHQRLWTSIYSYRFVLKHLRRPETDE